MVFEHHHHTFQLRNQPLSSIWGICGAETILVGLHRKGLEIYKGRRVKKAACPKRSRIEKGRC